jgi:hypothetical protein
MIHQSQSSMPDMSAMSLSIKPEIDHDIGNYVDQKLRSSTVTDTMKRELFQDLSKYIEQKVGNEMSSMESHIDGVQWEMGIMDRKISDLVAATNQDSVKFNGFVLRLVEEANAWVESNMPDHKFGMLVDVHMVFELLYSSTAKTITTLQQLAKIEMKDLSQGVAVSSFDTQLPKLRSDVTGYVAVKTDKSYLNQIQTHKIGLSLRLIFVIGSKRMLKLLRKLKFSWSLTIHDHPLLCKQQLHSCEHMLWHG